MKSESKIITFLVIGLISIISVGMMVQNDVHKTKTVSLNKKAEGTVKESNHIKDEEEQEENVEPKAEEVAVVEPTPVPTPTPDPIVYDGLTMNELADKLNRSLGSTLSGTGYTFASKSLSLGIDPYLAVAIVLHETGCKWECSYLVQACNNVGGMKGDPGCGGGSYKAFSTLDEGIDSYLNNLYRNYYAYGLTSPDTIGPKYAASTAWPSKIYYYMDTIRSN